MRRRLNGNGIVIIDVTLRDGLQNEERLLTADDKLRLINALLSAGLKHLQVCSFVNPARVPQMRDVEDLCERLPRAAAGGVDANYSALVLNQKGLERLRRTPIKGVDLSLSCSDAHSMRNSGMPVAEAKRQIMAMISTSKEAGLRVRAGLQCAFGCDTQGVTPQNVVLELSRALLAAGCDQIALADSTGSALPTTVRDLVAKFQAEFGQFPILHLHDTEGLAMVNFMAAYAAGVRAFDTSLGGLGGCPYIPSAGGNLATEEVVHLMERLGMAMEESFPKLLQAVAIAEAAVGHALPGKLYQLHKNRRQKSSTAIALEAQPS